MSQFLQRTFWSVYGRFVWDEQKVPWKTSQVQHIVEILQGQQISPHEHVLDAGCGTGNYSLALARAGFQVTGIDYATGMLSRAKVKVSSELDEDILFQQMDLNAPLLFPNTYFDHIINISALQVTDRPINTLGEFWRVLKPGGTLVLLHVPKPESHNLPLRETIRYRVKTYGNGSLWKKTLIAAKAWAERSNKTRYWSVVELQEMLMASHFRILSLELGPPIVIVAERSEQ